MAQLDRRPHPLRTRRIVVVSSAVVAILLLGGAGVPVTVLRAYAVKRGHLTRGAGEGSAGDDAGYDGWVGAEYRPRGVTSAGLVSPVARS